MSLESDVRLLANVKPFAPLPREALRLIAFSCEKRKLRAGERLFAQGEPSDGGFVVLSGEIELRRGEETRRVGPGVLIGQSALFAETSRPGDAVGVSDSDLLRISRETFRRVLSEFPDSAAEIRRAAKSRAQAMISRLESLRRRRFAAEGGR